MIHVHPCIYLHLHLINSATGQSQDGDAAGRAGHLEAARELKLTVFDAASKPSLVSRLLTRTATGVTANAERSAWESKGETTSRKLNQRS